MEFSQFRQESKYNIKKYKAIKIKKNIPIYLHCAISSTKYY